MPRIVRFATSCLGTMLLLLGAVAGVINHEVLDADRFSAHVDAIRTDPDVARQLGALITRRLVEEQPDLVALRPLIEATATRVVASRPLGPVVRGSLAPLYDALVLGENDPVVLQLADVAAVVVAAISVLSPQTAVALPADLDVRLSDIGAGELVPGAVEPVRAIRLLTWLAPLLGLTVLAAPAAFAESGVRRRRALAGVGHGLVGAGGLMAALLVLAVALVGRSDPDTLAGAVRIAVRDQLAGPFWIVSAGLAAVGLVVTLVADRPTDRSRRLLLSVLAAAVGVALLTDPTGVAAALLWLVGALLLIGGVVTALVTLTRVPAGRTALASAAGVLLAGIVVAAWPDDHHLDTRRAVAGGSGCNGHVELCHRRYDEVAYPATHNSMAAASEPGWFFPEQPDGLVDQLDAGVRVLLIDSWYGRETNRPGVVTTVGEARARAVAEATESFGRSAVDSALRLGGAVGLTPRGPQEAYLCHGLCEIGSTRWLDSLEAVRDWLDVHPREVVTLFVQDQVSPSDTAALIERAGLLPDVYRPADDATTWPTLGQMVESGRRLVVLMENRAGAGERERWLLPGFEEVQDTPFLFRSPAALIDGSDTCAHNRGEADAPLLLVNHWVTDKSAEVTNAARVNAHDVLAARVASCREQRGMLPNFVAVDFYDRGDLFGVVDDLNGLR
ncbi:hypothetical protein [Nocardioides panacihumi]|uniref:hypothetical protein n=1 Tax=Nocardioides panacihumi TaxID=400774 RepID=UPI0031DC33A0